MIYIEKRANNRLTVAYSYAPDYRPGIDSAQRVVEVIHDAAKGEIYALRYPMSGRYGAHSADPADYPQHVEALKTWVPA